MTTRGESPNSPPSSPQTTPSSPQTTPSSPQAPPPPSSQHFASFDNFVPDDSASFDCEFARLASSQQWIPGSQQYTRQRTIAIREELTSLYFSRSTPPPALAGNNDDEGKEQQQQQAERLTNAQKLHGYQDLCREIGITPCDTIDECKKQLKSTLVNIVDLIDARRTSSTARVWHDFDAFRAYTLQDEHRINKEEAKEGEGFLASLLQDFRLPRQRGRKRRRNPVKIDNTVVVVNKVIAGRVGRNCQR